VVLEGGDLGLRLVLWMGETDCGHAGSWAETQMGRGGDTSWDMPVVPRRTSEEIGELRCQRAQRSTRVILGRSQWSWNPVEKVRS
jgi:hypothetical protein